MRPPVWMCHMEYTQLLAECRRETYSERLLGVGISSQMMRESAVNLALPLGHMNTLMIEWKKISGELGSAFLGLSLAIAVAIIARFVHGMIPGTLNVAISEILVAIVLGLCIRNAFGVSAEFEPGIKFALHRVLRLGIILLGLRLSLQDVVLIGGSALLLIVTCITVVLLLAYAMGRIFQMPPRLAALIGIGTAVCGNSAIVAAAPVIEANEDDVSFAVATITLFGLLTVVLYPIIGQRLVLSDRMFGLWAGTAVNDTSQVVAVGAAYSSIALNVATVVKLTRNTLMAPLIVVLGLVYGQSNPSGDKPRSSLTIGKIIPGFILGFLAFSLLRTAGVAAGILPQNVDRPGNLQHAAALLKSLDGIAKFAILTALTAVGLGTNVQSMQRIGLKPFAVGLCVAAVQAMVSLSLIVAAALG